MRAALLLVITLAGCGARTSGPAWPKREIAASDGGESLAPHMARSIAAAAVEEDKPPPATATAIPITPVAEGIAPVTAVTAPAADEPITTEDIVIEVRDDD